MLNNNKPMFNVYRKGIQIENKLKIHHKTLKLKKKKTCNEEYIRITV